MTDRIKEKSKSEDVKVEFFYKYIFQYLQPLRSLVFLMGMITKIKLILAQTRLAYRKLSRMP